MPKRQLILLLIMGLALVYAAVTLLADDGKQARPIEASNEDLAKLSKQVDDMLAESKLNAIEEYRISLLSGDGVGDPLVKRAPKDDDALGIASRTGDERFTYSAYIRIGGMELAVINDEECALGDPVAETGYTLDALTRDHAVIQGSNPETGALEKVVIPIQEDIVTFPEEDDTTDEETDA